MDEARGFWDGAACNVCAKGWAEPVCTTKNVAVSRSGADMAAVSLDPDADADTVVVTDERERLLYTGGLPLIVFRFSLPTPTAVV